MHACAALPTGRSPVCPLSRAQEPSASHLGSSFPYTLAVIHESLRLYPPAHTTTRECTAPQGCTISSATQQYFIPHGTWIHISVYSVHHSEALWRDPSAFRCVMLACTDRLPDSSPDYLESLTSTVRLPPHG